MQDEHVTAMLDEARLQFKRKRLIHGDAARCLFAYVARKLQEEESNDREEET